MQNQKLAIYYDFFYFNEKINVDAFYSIKKPWSNQFLFYKKNVTDYVHKTFHYFIDDGIEMLSYEGCQIIYAFW